MQSFLDQQLTLDIPQDFISRFAQNYENRNTWVQSDVLYEWFGKNHNKNYNHFTKEITKQLTIDVDYKLTLQVSVQNKGGRGHKTIYQVSQTGIKKMAMVGDKNVRDYYIQLEELAFKFIDHQLAIQQQQQQSISQELEETKQQHSELQIKYNGCCKTGFIYGFQHKKYRTVDYVGFTTNTIDKRIDNHMFALTSATKIPFFQMFQYELLQIYDVIAIEKLQYYDEQELRDKELYWQMYHKSIQSNTEYQCQKCNRILKQRSSFQKHRAKCYSDPYSSDTD